MYVCMYNFYIQTSRVMLKAYLFRKKGWGIFGKKWENGL